MQSRDFCYWLQGYLELTERGKDEARSMDSDQVLCIKKHLAMVFKHEIDPSFGGKEHQNVLNQLHGKPDVMMRC